MTAFIIHIRIDISKNKLKYYISIFLNSQFLKSKFINLNIFIYSEKESFQIRNCCYLNIINNIKSFQFLILQNSKTSKILDKSINLYLILWI